MLPFNEAWGRVIRIESAIEHDEAKMLYRYAASEAPEGLAVEIGAWKGRSAILMALAGRLVVSVDRFGSYRTLAGSSLTVQIGVFNANVLSAGVSERVRTITGESSGVGEAWVELGAAGYYPPYMPIGLLFVDGDHRLEGVRADWLAWKSNVPPGGIVAWHDYCLRSAGVKQAVDEAIERGELEMVDVVPTGVGLAVTRRTHVEG